MPIGAAGLDFLREEHPHEVHLFLSVIKPQIIYQGTVTGSHFQKGRRRGGVSSVGDRSLAIQVAIDLWTRLRQE